MASSKKKKKIIKKGKPIRAILIRQDIEQPRKPGEQVHIISDGPVHVVLDNTIPGGFRMEPVCR